MPGPIIPPSTPPSGPTAPGGSTSFTANDVIKQAMLEIGAIDPNETPSAGELNTGLSKLNRLLDGWDADGRYVYSQEFTQYTLIPGLQPHTIGPASATFTVAQRPVKILNANIILNNNPQNPVRSPLYLRDDDWWSNKRAYAVAGALPTDLYYSPGWPNGALYLWIVPTVAYPLELETWTLLGQLQPADKFSLPPGYLDAVVYSLAFALCPSFQTQPSAALVALQQKAVARIFGPNTAAPLIGTRDAGMPNARRQRPYFNWRSGMMA